MSDDIKPIEPKTIDYCPHCTFPVEYCEFSNCWPKCSVSLKDKHPALYEKFKAAKDAKAAAAKAKAQAELAAKDPEAAAALLAKEEEEKAKKAAEGPSDEDDDEDDSDGELEFTDITPGAGASLKKEISIQVSERTRRKRVTTVMGVENFGIVQKDLAKLFAKKFATSASSGPEGIVLNGDLLYDIADFILEQYPEIPEAAFIRIEKGGIRKKVF